MCLKKVPRNRMTKDSEEGDGVLNWTSSGVIGERVRVMSIDTFSWVGGGEGTRRGGDSMEEEEVLLVDSVFEGALEALALEMEALVDAMVVDIG
nr:hypothetical protein [Tanacetum cinerariifolium]